MRIRVCPEPVLISIFWPSLRTKDPMLIQPGVAASAAMSAVIFVPPVAAVTETLANDSKGNKTRQAKPHAANEPHNRFGLQE